MKKTKMICTVGPASETEEIITKFIEAGMNASRHNFSHGDHEEHRGRMELVKKYSKKIKQGNSSNIRYKGTRNKNR